MSAPEYAPGTVVMAKCSDDEWRRALFGKRVGTDALTFADGTWRDACNADIRPLVVIDPEDREQVGRLSLAVAVESQRIGASFQDDQATAMQAVLREFANPTPAKPTEPTGLGAVVEDAEGGKWLRVCMHAGCNSWRKFEEAVSDIDLSPGARSYYADISAVRVLSEGVQ